MFQCVKSGLIDFVRRSILHKGWSVSWRREPALLQPASDALSPSPTYQLSQRGEEEGKKPHFNQVASNGCLSQRLKKKKKNNPGV